MLFESRPLVATAPCSPTTTRSDGLVGFRVLTVGRVRAIWPVSSWHPASADHGEEVPRPAPPVLGASLVRVSAQASNPRSGTWKLNLAKSKYDPGPAPQRNTMKIEASGEGEKATTEGVNAAGTATGTQYTAQYDGKDYPMTGSQNADTVSL